MTSTSIPSTRSDAQRFCVVGVCRRLFGAPFWRAGVRSTGGPHRSQVHLPDHHRNHGCVDLSRRHSAQLRHDRLAGTGGTDCPAHGAGLALGGEYGGAAIYVAEHAPQNRRGFYTSFIQTTATLGLLLSLVVILFTQIYVNANYPEVVLANGTKITAFASWGWRIPHVWLSVLWLAFRQNRAQANHLGWLLDRGVDVLPTL